MLDRLANLKYLPKEERNSKMDGFLLLLMLGEMLIVFHGLKLNITFSKALSSHVQSLNGTS